MTQTTTLRAFYTNQTTDELLQKLNEPAFSEEQISTFHPSAAELVRKNQSELLSRPVTGIRRLATEGSQTRLGGKISRGSSELTLTLKSGEKVSAAVIGDQVEYPDGRIAHIATGAGKSYSDLALVGSRLDNGDEIINTPQDGCLLVMRVGDVWDSDFLPNVGAE